MLCLFNKYNIVIFFRLSYKNVILSIHHCHNVIFHPKIIYKLIQGNLTQPYSEQKTTTGSKSHSKEKSVIIIFKLCQHFNNSFFSFKGEKNQPLTINNEINFVILPFFSVMCVKYLHISKYIQKNPTFFPLIPHKKASALG